MRKILRFLNNNPYFNAIRNIRAVLDYDQKKRAVYMMGLLLVNAVFDVFGLAAIYPLMSAALEPASIQRKWFLRYAYDFIGIEDYVGFLFVLSIIVFVVFLIKNGVSLFILYIQARFSYNIALRLSLKQFQKYYLNGYLYINDRNIGKKRYDINGLPSQFAASYLLQTIIFTTELVVLLLIFCGVMWKAPEALIILLFVVIPVFLVIYQFSKKRVAKIGSERNRLYPQITSMISESMSAYPDVKLANKEADYLERFKVVQKDINRLDTLNNGLYQKIPSKTNDIVFGLGLMLVFMTAFLFRNSSAEILSILSIFGLAAYRFLPSINRMMAAVLGLKNLSFFSTEFDEIRDKKIVEFMKVEPLPIKKDIVFHQISYSYPKTNIVVLDDFNLKVHKGETIGIVGSSGSGKTTILNLLLRLIEETGGKIEVDGKVLDKKLNPRFQKNIGYVQQDVFIKDGTLAENIAFGVSDVDFEKVQDVITKSMLKDLVLSNKNGAEMQLGENGVKLSGGQKQRVGIARALYKDSQILVFDEATSSLDMDTENAIKETISALSQSEYTIFIVAHRITTLKSCDRIIELDKGRIIREYSYKQLFNEKILTEEAI